MVLLRKSGQLSNEVIFKAPCQIGGEKSNATDPGKPEGSHFIETKNRDSMLSADRGKEGGKASHATDPGKPEGSHFIKTKNRVSMPSADRASKAAKATLGKRKGGSTECYVTEEVNPVDKTPLSEKRSWFANTKAKAAAQLVFKGAVPSYSSCANRYMNLWTKEANDTESKTTFIQGKKKAKDRLWKLIIVTEEPEGITAVDDEMYKELSAQCRKADALAKVHDRNRKCESY
jgi:hypothetical protein